MLHSMSLFHLLFPDVLFHVWTLVESVLGLSGHRASLKIVPSHPAALQSQVCINIKSLDMGGYPQAKEAKKFCHPA
jgi:hypothetical protein